MNSEQLIDAKLRRFYTYFCYKEAYIKLSGEALLAPWIKALEFFGVRSPKPGVKPRCSTHGVWGEEVDDVEVHLHKKEVSDVKMKIQAFEEDFMISTAMQGDVEGLKVPGFTTLNVDSDVMRYAQQNLNQMSKSP
jgi:4'-phosphopantetheinyl transferase